MAVTYTPQPTDEATTLTDEYFMPRSARFPVDELAGIALNDSKAHFSRRADDADRRRFGQNREGADRLRRMKSDYSTEAAIKAARRSQAAPTTAATLGIILGSGLGGLSNR